MSRLEDRLVLNRFFFDLIGSESFEQLKGLLRMVDEGPDAEGQSNFYGRLATQPGLKLDREKLAEYDQRVLDYERQLSTARREFRGFRYFQYLALLFTEIYLDRLTTDPRALLHELNGFLAELKQEEPETADIPSFEINDLRRMAFFMATGSGKTLLMHVNIRQVLHYLKCGRHAGALVKRADGRGEFDNVILITPNEGLSAQHIDEFHASGLNAGLFIDDPHGRGDLFGTKVKVIEIHKLAEEASGDGVSVALDALGTANFILVDEGHKGAGTEARVWKTRQQRLSANGFLLEYSATFAQAIAAAGTRARQTLIGEYGKAILFDYSYAHFYGDGYGKNFNVLNLSRARADHAHELLMGGLLTFYNQLNLYHKNEITYRRYNIEKPLWVMLGSSVNAIFTREGRRRSDVAEVVSFLRQCIEEKDWATKTIRRILDGDSGFTDMETGLDLFSAHIQEMKRRSPEALYRAILKDVFHGSGALEIWELKNADGEIGLRVSVAESGHLPYFGVINIGDVATFRKYLKEHVGMDVQEDRFSKSRFEEVNRTESPTHILIGAKKFIEGWSSWRVSSMGLLNVGRGEGSQVIQLFGRGVRLKGKDMSLKRTEALPDSTEKEKEQNRRLETLYIFGWNADYIQTFRNILEQEDIGRDFIIPVKHKDPWPKNELPVPQKKAGFDLSALTWTLHAEGPAVGLDMMPRITGFVGAGESASLTAGKTASAVEVNFKDDKYFELVNLDELYSETIDYKKTRGYQNVYVSRDVIGNILRDYCKADFAAKDARSPLLIQEAAGRLVKKYLDRFVRRMEREAEFHNTEPAWLEPDNRVTNTYRVRVKRNGFFKQIENLLKKPLPEQDASEPVPRFYIEWHLFSPILTEGGKEWKKAVSVKPPALVKTEAELVKDLKNFWRMNHKNPAFEHLKVYLLRNLPKAGIGLFHRSGFYPDFIMWLRNIKTGAVHVRFIDPHGLHHGGLAGSMDKFAALSKLKEFSELPDFKSKKISLDGFTLADTPIEQIPDAKERNWADLEKEYPLIRRMGDYCRRLFTVD